MTEQQYSSISLCHPTLIKVYLARQKKPDSLVIVLLESFHPVSNYLCFGYYAYNHFDHLHFHVTKAYAHLGYEDAQHQVGQRYLHGKGVEQHRRGDALVQAGGGARHPHASYNLAVGHLKGLPSDLKAGRSSQNICTEQRLKGHYSSSRYGSMMPCAEHGACDD
uniref:Uncharacterized protein n=1 Tax=Macrostomum lignano TaxID=282301 RepID=A0A1I8F7W6_9PLAT